MPVPLATDELVRPLGIIHRRGKKLSATTRRFIELLQREGQADVAGENESAATAAGNYLDERNGHALAHGGSAGNGNGAKGQAAGENGHKRANLEQASSVEVAELEEAVANQVP